MPEKKQAEPREGDRVRITLEGSRYGQTGVFRGVDQEAWFAVVQLDNGSELRISPRYVESDGVEPKVISDKPSRDQILVRPEQLAPAAGQNAARPSRPAAAACHPAAADHPASR
jgi:hypothetical protein